MQALLFFTFEQTNGIMVRFNELRITEDRKCLIVDCEIEPIGLYANMYIDEIRLDYYKNVDSSGLPTTKSYLMWQHKEGDPEMKGVRTSAKEQDIIDAGFDIDLLDDGLFRDGLFFVTVICSGAPSSVASTLPCGTDVDRESQAVIDWKGFYERGMQFISSMYGCGADKCAIPAGFEDFVLLWNALKAAIAVCDWPMVAKLWDRITRSGMCGRPNVGLGSACGCGR